MRLKTDSTPPCTLHGAQEEITPRIKSHSQPPSQHSPPPSSLPLSVAIHVFFLSPHPHPLTVPPTHQPSPLLNSCPINVSLAPARGTSFLLAPSVPLALTGLGPTATWFHRCCLPSECGQVTTTFTNPRTERSRPSPLTDGAAPRCVCLLEEDEEETLRVKALAIVAPAVACHSDATGGSMVGVMLGGGISSTERARACVRGCARASAGVAHGV